MKISTMSFFLMFIISYMVATSVYAADKANNLSSVQSDICDTMESLAITAMESHQSGLALSMMTKKYKEISKKSGVSPPFINLGLSIIISAYKQPIYTSKTMQKKTTQEFRDGIYSICITNPSFN